jgi:hypothetical protein
MKRFFVYSVILMFVIISAGCDSWKSSPPDGNHTISVTNSTDCDLGILLDETEYLHLPSRNDMGSFERVAEGYHDLEAYELDSMGPGTQIDAIRIYVSERKDYFWNITDCPVE